MREDIRLLRNLQKAGNRLRITAQLISVSDGCHLWSERFERKFYLRRGLIEPFIGACREMNDRGWVMKVEDAYRSADMQKALGQSRTIFKRILDKVIWEGGSNRPSMELMFGRLSVLVATRPKIGTHMSGSAVDISILLRDSGRELDRGRPYLELSERTPMASPFVSESAQRNRREITELMSRWGFAAYPYEFWHYSQGDAFVAQVKALNVHEAAMDAKGDAFTAPHEAPIGSACYGAVSFDPRTLEVIPLEDPFQSLHTEDELKTLLETVSEK